MTNEQIVGALEYLKVLFTSGHVVLVEVERSKNHVRQLEIFNFISLLNRDVLELLLIIQIGEYVVSAVSFDPLGSLLANLWSFSSIPDSELLEGIRIHGVDSKSKQRVNLTSIPNLLLIAVQ